MKWFIRLFVALCLFLVGGYNVLHSQPQHHVKYDAHHIIIPTKAHLASLSASENPVADYSNAVSYKAKIRGVIDDNDDEDDDDTSSSRGLFLAVPLQPVLVYSSRSGYRSESTPVRLPFREHYLYTSSSRYLLFNVFRI